MHFAEHTKYASEQICKHPFFGCRIRSLHAEASFSRCRIGFQIPNLLLAAKLTVFEPAPTPGKKRA
jgi:hypothetical protein